MTAASKEGNANCDDGLSQRVDEGYFNNWKHDRKCPIIEDLDFTRI